MALGRRDWKSLTLGRHGGSFFCFTRRGIGRSDEGKMEAMPPRYYSPHNSRERRRKKRVRWKKRRKGGKIRQAVLLSSTAKNAEPKCQADQLDDCLTHCTVKRDKPSEPKFLAI
jgi:hypothetical protein